MHYFEEDEIIGKLYNDDGTEFKTETKKNNTKTEPKKQEKTPKNQQPTLFDLLDNNTINTENTIKIEEKSQKMQENQSFKAQCAQNSQPDPLDDNLFADSEIAQNECAKIEPPKTATPQPQEYYKFYHEQELNYPDIVVLTRLGDFYEAFNENATKIAKVLDLMLTSKNVGLQNKVQLAGFPVHVKDTYLAKLQKHYTILIIEDKNLTFYEKIQEKSQEIGIENQTFDKFLLKTIAVLLDNEVVLK